MSKYSDKQNKSKPKTVQQNQPPKAVEAKAGTMNQQPSSGQKNTLPAAGLTLDQRRAKHALGQVRAIIDRGDTTAWRSKYRAYVRGMPLALRMNGLGQFIAVEMSQANRNGHVGDGHSEALTHVLKWLTDQVGGWTTTPYGLQPVGNETAVERGKRTIEKLAERPETEMLRAQRELTAYLKWLKTFAEALIPVETGDA